MQLPALPRDEKQKRGRNGRVFFGLADPPLVFASCIEQDIHSEVNRFRFDGNSLMDKKAKKRLQVLRQKLEKSEKILAAARQQTDEPGEVEAIQKQIADYKAEIEKLKSS